MSKCETKDFRIEEVESAMIAWWDEVDGGTLALHDECKWISAGKSEYCAYILKEKATGNYYSVEDSRSGSCYLDWNYDSSDWGDIMTLKQVEPKEVTTISWAVTSKDKESK